MLWGLGECYRKNNEKICEEKGENKSLKNVLDKELISTHHEKRKNIISSGEEDIYLF
jgi:hypothetical protein